MNWDECAGDLERLQDHGSVYVEYGAEEVIPMAPMLVSPTYIGSPQHPLALRAEANRDTRQRRRRALGHRCRGRGRRRCGVLVWNRGGRRGHWKKEMRNKVLYHLCRHTKCNREMSVSYVCRCNDSSIHLEAPMVGMFILVVVTCESCVGALSRVARMYM